MLAILTPMQISYFIYFFLFEEHKNDFEELKIYISADNSSINSNFLLFEEHTSDFEDLMQISSKIHFVRKRIE